MLADQIRGILALEHPRGFLIDIDVIPVFVEYDDSVIHVLDDVNKLFGRKRLKKLTCIGCPLAILLTGSMLDFHTFAPRINSDRKRLLSKNSIAQGTLDT